MGTVGGPRGGVKWERVPGGESDGKEGVGGRGGYAAKKVKKG